MPSDNRSWIILKHAYLRTAELKTLLDLFGTVDDIVDQPRSRLLESGLSVEKCDALATPDEKVINAALDWLDEDTHHLVAWGQDTYPEMLTQIPGPPLVLYVNGNIDADPLFFARKARYEHDLQQEIADLLTELRRVRRRKGVHHLVGLLEEVRGKGFESLLAVPWASPRVAKAIHDF